MSRVTVLLKHPFGDAVVCKNATPLRQQGLGQNVLVLRAGDVPCTSAFFVQIQALVACGPSYNMHAGQAILGHTGINVNARRMVDSVSSPLLALLYP